MRTVTAVAITALAIAIPTATRADGQFERLAQEPPPIPQYTCDPRAADEEDDAVAAIYRKQGLAMQGAIKNQRLKDDPTVKDGVIERIRLRAEVDERIAAVSHNSWRCREAFQDQMQIWRALQQNH